jgi:hypothetical protein
VADVLDRPGKTLHRFDVVNASRQKQKVEVAAGGPEAKRRWVAAIETERQLWSRVAAGV